LRPTLFKEHEATKDRNKCIEAIGSTFMKPLPRRPPIPGPNRERTPFEVAISNEIDRLLPPELRAIRHETQLEAHFRHQIDQGVLRGRILQGSSFATTMIRGELEWLNTPVPAESLQGQPLKEVGHVIRRSVLARYAKLTHWTTTSSGPWYYFLCVCGHEAIAVLRDGVFLFCPRPWPPQGDPLCEQNAKCSSDACASWLLDLAQKMVVDLEEVGLIHRKLRPLKNGAAAKAFTI
jgi:hypothetical protein